MKNIVLKVGLLPLLPVKNKMKKIICLFILLNFFKFYQVYSQANELYYSPYSYYGLGDYVPNNSLRNRALGHIGIANSSPINIVMDNPASYADLKQTTFEFSGSSKFSQFMTDTLSISRSNVAFDGITLGFPTNKRFTIVMGLTPLTKTGYKVKQLSDLYSDDDTLKILTIRSGDGGINQAVLGFGVPLFKNKLKVGINAKYLFGNLSRYKETVFLFESKYSGTMVRNRMNYQGFGWQLGLMYADSIGKSTFKIGASYQSSINFKTYQISELNDVFFSFYSVNYQPFDTVELGKGNYKKPSVWGFGIGLEQFNQFTYGLDFQFYDASDTRPNEPYTTFQKSFLVRTGLEWVPKFSEDNYWKKMAYRIGAYYHQSELKLFNQNINQMAITFGLGFPFRRTFSRLNFSFELGQRGILKPNLVKETYFSTGLGVTFNETWFIKRRLE